MKTKSSAAAFAVAAVLAVAPIGASGQGSGITITRSNGTVEKLELKAPRPCGTHQVVKCSCRTSAPSSITITRSSSVQPVAAQQQTVVTQLVVQQIVAPQPVYVAQPVVYDTTPRKFFYTSPLVSVSAYAGVSTYGSGYYSGTYFQNDSMCQERYNIAQTRYNYGFGGGGRSHGSYGGGIQPMPPVRYMPGVQGVQLGGHHR